jgi:predicted HTH transcriptional regulator
VDGPELNELVKNIEGETRNIELKTSMSWSDQGTKLKIVKSILAMSNIRSGGMVIIGIDEKWRQVRPHRNDNRTSQLIQL